MRFRDLSLKYKQFVALGFLLVFMGGANFYSTTRLARMKNDIDEVSNFWLARNQTLGDLQNSISLLRLSQIQLSTARDPERRIDFALEAAAAIDSILANMDDYVTMTLDSLNRDLNDQELRLAANERQTLDSFEDSWDQYLEELLPFLDPEETLDESTRVRVFDLSEDDFLQVRQNLVSLIELNHEAWRESELRAENDFRSARYVSRLLFLGSLVVALFIIGAIVRITVRPIVALTRAAARVAEGDRDIRINVDAADEVGRLSHSFNRMTSALREQETELLRRQRETEEQNAALEDLLARLTETQQQLIVREKMASLGQLTAGIAHEIKNPLNFVNNFSKMSADIIDELVEELRSDGSRAVSEVLDEIEDLLDDLKFNAQRIIEHGSRADSIVKSMLLHSRGKPGDRVKTDINGLLEEYLNLAFHGMRASDSTFNTELVREYGDDVGELLVVRQDIGRVFLNVLNNAFHAVNQRRKREKDLSPRVRVTTRTAPEGVVVEIEDNGVGIPHDVIDRIFEPFFTTKPAGSGTGLGLSLAYEIVTDGHGGAMEVNSTPGEGTTVLISLPD